MLWNESTRVDTIFQDFGSRYSYILPFENRKAYGEGNVLLCFENDRLGPVDFEKDHLVNCPSCGFTTFEYDCGVISSTQSSPISDSDFSIYPNPATSYLSLHSENISIENVKMYNLQGQIILEKKANSQTLEIDISDLNAGMYVLINNDSFYEKIVVSKN